MEPQNQPSLESSRLWTSRDISEKTYLLFKEDELVPVCNESGLALAGTDVHGVPSSGGREAQQGQTCALGNGNRRRGGVARGGVPSGGKRTLAGC